MDLEALKYPIGKFKWPENISRGDIKEWIHTIREFPEMITEAVKNLNSQQLDSSYRPEGWTVRQVVHHTADSHLNAYCRFRLALTEENPTIKPYFEALWASLPDASKQDIASSLELIKGLHERWVFLLESMSEEDFGRTFFHPDSCLALYSWHCRHHTAHITKLRTRMSW
jgi:hypothetical protein